MSTFGDDLIKAMTEALAHANYSVARDMPNNSLIGTPDTVVSGLRSLAQRTAADEIMIYPVAHAVSDRLRALEGISTQWA